MASLDNDYNVPSNHDDDRKDKAYNGYALLVNAYFAMLESLPMSLSEQAEEISRVENAAKAAQQDAVHLVDALEKEKARRIYYQEIVYAVCNILDSHFGDRRTIVGTVDNPSTDVRSRVAVISARAFKNWHEKTHLQEQLDEAMSRASQTG